ncbi:septum formation inhibitor Maf [Muriicola jejuensis]|nr:septum formation inhibitor Maf [Muriicola jejuensis]
MAQQEDEVQQEQIKPKPLTQPFKDYWYAGEAEITSYELQQARYGELRPGKAVLIYVTEPFVPGKQVKADASSPSNISVLKLNATKNFLTGIYPYSVMSSTFYPVTDNQHALKVTSSIQEWCGHVFAQLNNRDQFEVSTYSYFESEGDQQISLDKVPLENEIWTRIRIRPEDLPVGTVSMIPSFDYLRLVHKPVQAYKTDAQLVREDGFFTYTLNYPELERKLIIRFDEEFPYTIDSWEETYPSGFGSNSKVLTTKARKISSLKTPYWRQNGTEDVSLRDTLGL